jgi:hypothetical protein
MDCGDAGQMKRDPRRSRDAPGISTEPESAAPKKLENRFPVAAPSAGLRSEVDLQRLPVEPDACEFQHRLKMKKPPESGSLLLAGEALQSVKSEEVRRERQPGTQA